MEGNSTFLPIIGFHPETMLSGQATSYQRKMSGNIQPEGIVEHYLWGDETPTEESANYGEKVGKPTVRQLSNQWVQFV